MSVAIAVQDVQGASVALEQGADRIELCAALGATGGITPSFAMIGACAQIGVPQGVHVLVRPRGGPYVFDRDEKNVQLADVRAAIIAGASGVMVGGLSEDGAIDVPFARDLVQTARDAAENCGRSVQTTFNRAFDQIVDKRAALETLIDLGYTRVLTSAGAPTAAQGASELKALVEQAKGRIEIEAGGGIMPANVGQVVASGVDAIHFSARRVMTSDRGSDTNKAGAIERTDATLAHAIFIAIQSARESLAQDRAE